MTLVTETLASYRARVLRELRDSAQSYFTSTADLDAWINEAVRWRDLWSGGSRSYRAAVALTPGLDQYSFTVLFPTETVLDLINLWLIWGNYRRRLEENTLTEVTQFARPLVSYTNIPAMFCRYGATGLFIATAPSGNYSADFDVSVLSGTLVAVDARDPLPYPYTEPVVKYACALAKEWQVKYDEAEMFKQAAIVALHDIEGSRAGMLPQPTVSRR